jgi:hypothetical protein
MTAVHNLRLLMVTSLVTLCVVPAAEPLPLCLSPAPMRLLIEESSTKYSGLSCKLQSPCLHLLLF